MVQEEQSLELNHFFTTNDGIFYWPLPRGGGGGGVGVGTPSFCTAIESRLIGALEMTVLNI